MKLIYIIIFFFINIITSITFSQTIAIVNVQSLIDNNIIYKKTLKDIESNQQKYLKNFDTKENELKTKLKDIEEAKLILSDEEINFQIENYNNELSKFTTLIEEFNLHYQNQIINIKEVILKEILKLLEK